MIAAIIPARGGSKGIPRKNLVPICGKPLIAWTIEQAMASTLVDEVWVATDDREIALAAVRYGAYVSARSPATATDTASSESCIAEWIAREGMDECEAVVFLQATSPIRQPEDIDKAITIFRTTQADSLFSCRRLEGYVWRQSGDVVSQVASLRVPRQSRTVESLEENGSIYIATPQQFLTGSRFGGKVVPYYMHPWDSFQVDEPADIPLIESLMEIRLGCHAAATH